MAGARPAFSAETFRFLRELAANNEREWFQANVSTAFRAASDCVAFLCKAVGVPF